MKVSMVTVTYGSRQDLLEEVIRSVQGTGLIEDMIVVSNNAQLDVDFHRSARHSNTSLVSLPTNSGSANGFAVGITEFLKGSSEYVLILDDDNRPSPGSIQKLLAFAAEKQKNGQHCAVLGYRPDHQPWVGQGKSVENAYPPATAFLSFTVALFVERLIRRTIRPGPTRRTEGSQFVVPYAPYGGLLLDRGLVEKIGLPRRDFYLYCDDTEFTHRITKIGIPINLLVDAKIDDISTSWSSPSGSSNSFQRLLGAGSDFQVFYATRNRIYFEKSRLEAIDWVSYVLNMTFFFFLLGTYAIFTRRLKRFGLILRATLDGLRARLGVDPKFVLP